MANEKRNLIDRDLLIDSLGASDMEIFAKEVISEAPTVDAVEVVRCKDCKFAYINSYSAEQEKALCNRWFNHDGNAVLMQSDDFCSYGERREGE